MKEHTTLMSNDPMTALPPVRGYEKPHRGPVLPVAPEFDRRGRERRAAAREDQDRRGAPPPKPPGLALPRRPLC